MHGSHPGGQAGGSRLNGRLQRGRGQPGEVAEQLSKSKIDVKLSNQYQAILYRVLNKEWPPK